MLLKCIIDGDLEAKSPAAAQFFVIEKKAILMPLDHILRIFKSNLKEPDFKHLESLLKN